MTVPPIVVSVILFTGSLAFAFADCSQPEPVYVDKVQQSATRACNGLTPVWIDSNTIECVKETL